MAGSAIPRPLEVDRYLLPEASPTGEKSGPVLTRGQWTVTGSTMLPTANPPGIRNGTTLMPTFLSDSST